MNYIDLESVGSLLTKECIVFPIDCSEAPETASDAEEMMGVHILDTDDDWWANMSVEDCQSIMDFIDNLEAEEIPGFIEWGIKKLKFVKNANSIGSI